MTTPKVNIELSDEEPNVVYVNGQRVGLQQRNWQLLNIVVRGEGQLVSYDDIYRALFADRVVEFNQISFQKRRLLERIRNVAPDAGDIIKAIPKKGYLIDLDRCNLKVTRQGQVRTYQGAIRAPTECILPVAKFRATT